MGTSQKGWFVRTWGMDREAILREQYNMTPEQWAKHKRQYEERMAKVKLSSKYKRAMRAYKKSQKQKP